MRDGKNNQKDSIVLDPVSIASDTTTSGDNVIDVQGFDELTLVFAAAVTDGTYTPVVKEGSSSTGNGHTAVDDVDLIGSETALDTTNTVETIGYIGGERYVSVDLVSASTTTGAVVTVLARQGRPYQAPTTS